MPYLYLVVPAGGLPPTDQKANKIPCDIHGYIEALPISSSYLMPVPLTALIIDSIWH